MRKATAKVGASLMVAAAAFAFTPGAASAQPAGHQVRYTVSTAGPYQFDVTYLVNQPADKAAYNADAYAYLKRESVTIAPGQPFTFETTLTDPQWAYVWASSTTKGGQAAPNAHCEVAVDGQIVIQGDHPYSPLCQGAQW
ncbi:hypothetical protein H7H73_29970 [Mycobacterium rufum]|uniref:Secreted protein n=2 Tax=Mycolicibacterium rufum TaxID=318424 RepID=A0A9X2Y4Q1_9MYCO|nr:hypothetical protein [Mycolicibacterium rufum]MCV7073892.1 hypothetical protein [Mycolicibacterium rufum]